MADKKLPKIMSEAEADLARPKEDRNPGPKYIRKVGFRDARVEGRGSAWWSG